MRTAGRWRCRRGVEVHEGGAPELSVPAIAGARRSDLPSIRWLLDIEFLPSADLTEEALEHFLVHRDQLGVAGVIGLQLFGEVALLRSLVVSGERMGCGIGRSLVTAAETLAAELRVRSIYLLTTTAADFFEYRGFRRIGREEAPQEIRATQEFSSLCPSTAVLMVKP
jgi:amino-acid N-acetyltransferase